MASILKDRAGHPKRLKLSKEEKQITADKTLQFGSAGASYVAASQVWLSLREILAKKEVRQSEASHRFVLISK